VQHGLWREVDQDGVVLEILNQVRRDAKAANLRLKASSGPPPGMRPRIENAQNPAQKA
jgi:hypothetical protein